MSRVLDYFENNKKVGTFGIKYLDDKLRGIMRGDLILIGARSGAGKSTLADIIAQNNARAGFPVHLFSLENFEDDAYITKVYYFYKTITRNFDLDLRDFASGSFDINADALIEAEEKAKKSFNNVIITSRRKGYSIKNLKDDMIKTVVENGTRLIILDHIDYVDKDNAREDDNTHITELMRTIRNLQDEFKVAVVAFSHLRKPMNGKDLPAVPSIDEFIGSSNKIKEATVVVMIAPDDKENENNPSSTRKATWFCVRKLRMGGIDNKSAKMFFDRRIGKYDDNYDTYVVDYTGKKQEKIL
jgi:replicative DNA helicase